MREYSGPRVIRPLPGIEWQWYQQPVDAGQAVDVKYAADWENERLLRRTADRSTGEVRFQYANMRGDGSVFEPWNNVLPTVGEWVDYGTEESKR
jgi:hypothetical protein